MKETKDANKCKDNLCLWIGRRLLKSHTTQSILQTQINPYQNSNEDWSGSSGKMPALQSQSPEFKSQFNHPKKITLAFSTKVGKKKKPIKALN
jgi:hypothetical protein